MKLQKTFVLTWATVSMLFMLAVQLLLNGCSGETGSRGWVSIEDIEQPLRMAVLPGVRNLNNIFFDVETPVEIYSYVIPENSAHPLRELEEHYKGWQIIEKDDSHFVVKTNRIVGIYNMSSFIVIYMIPTKSEIIFAYGAMPTRLEDKMISGLKKKVGQFIKGSE